MSERQNKKKSSGRKQSGDDSKTPLIDSATSATKSNAGAAANVDKSTISSGYGSTL